MILQDPPALDRTGKALASALHEGNALLSAIAKDSLASVCTDWPAVARIVRTGSAPAVFSIGDQINDIFTDTTGTPVEYQNPWDITHFGTAELENGEVLPAMYLQTHWAQLYDMQFSNRAFLSCPEGLPAGTYHFTFASTWGKAIGGESVCFTTTQDIPAGGRIWGCRYVYNDGPLGSVMKSYAEDGKTVIETITPVMGTEGTFLGTMNVNTRAGNLNSIQEMGHGWNRWKTSAFRQFLNSSARPGSWWVPQDAWDIAPDQLATRPGYLAGLPEELVRLLKPVKVITYTNSVQDGGGADITYDRVFLPSTTEMHFAPYTAGLLDGEPHEYWKRVSNSPTPLPLYQTYPQYITYGIENHTSAKVVRLRSAFRGHASNTFLVYPSGIVYDYDAAGASRFSPLVAIC